MEALLSKLEALPAYKDLLKLWCRRNDIKVSFLVNMTLSKSKTIYSKLIKTYSKSLANFKLRWLQNELKLFHFCLLALSTLNEIKVQDFTQKEWSLLQQAFPYKSQAILEYQTMNFITSKNMLKKKWEPEEDRILSDIIRDLEQTIKWNQIAVQVFIKSNKLYFRSSKQCRERWLNHLDDSIKHQKWTDDEDKMLVSSVLAEGKKWSQIMRSFGNQRTEHMIKNRFISLVLKFRKLYPLIQDEDEVVKKMAEDMEIVQEKDSEQERHEIEKKLRPKHKKIEVSSEISQILEIQSENKEPTPEQDQLVPFPVTENSPFQPHHIGDESNCQNFENMMQGIPTPNFVSPLTYINCNSFANNFAYFQYYMNCFQRDFNSQ